MSRPDIYSKSVGYRAVSNLLGLGKSFVKLYLLRQRVPLFVQILLTSRCNSRCKYCNIPLRDQKELSTERILRLIDEMAAAGTYRVGLYGGEPLLRDDIFTIVQHAKKKGLMVHLYTNGLLVKQNIDTIRLLDGIFISIDGPEEIHNELRGKGNFKKVIEAIELSNQYVPVYLMTVLTKQNKKYISYISELSIKYDCLVNYQVVFETPSLSADVSPYKLDTSEREECIKEIMALKNGNPRIALSNTNLQRMLNRTPSLQKKGYQCGVIKCWNGRGACVIDSDGVLYSCYQLIGKEKALNLNEHTFQDAFKYINSCTCLTCDVGCGAEYNLWLSLNPESVLNLVGLLRRSSRRKSSLHH